MDSKDKEISELKKLVKKLQKENDYLKSPLYHFTLTEQIQERYSVLLNPPSKDFRTTKGQKAAIFKINITDIVCILSDGKSKWVHFKEPQKSIEGVLLDSDKLSFTGTLLDFCNKYDDTKIHLCIVSKSVAVNPLYYQLDKDKLKLADNKISNKYCDNIKVSPKYLKEFVERKSIIESIISFQKI